MKLNHIARTAASALLAGSLLLTLTACMVSPAGKSSQSYRPFYAEPEKRTAPSATAGDGLPEIITPSSGRTIAVTDIAYKQEFRDFFYDENATSKTEILEMPRQAAPQAPSPPAVPGAPGAPGAPPTPAVPPPQTQGPHGPLPQHIPDPAPMRNQSSLERRAHLQSVLFRTAQATEREIAPTPPANPAANALPDNNDAAAGPRGTRNEYAYSKRYGIERKVSYGELRGVAADIRALLIKSGYRIVAGRPAVEKPLQNDLYFDILGRIKAGDFPEADYVLFGVLTEIAISEHNESIMGTRNSMQFHVLDLAVDFSLINTQTGQVVASFTAVGSGREQRIDGKATGYRPRLVQLVRQASATMAEDVALQLNSQNLAILPAAPQHATGPAAEAIGSGGSTKRRLDEDARSLRVYR